jgi:tripartite-type tricarboxylate transporter receptor subunit TctC
MKNLLSYRSARPENDRGDAQEVAYGAGRSVRALAVTSPKRSKLQPELPTVAEPGIFTYSSVGWIVLLVPAKTSADIVARLSGESVRLLNAPEIVSRFETLGNEIVASSPETILQELRSDQLKMGWADQGQGYKARINSGAIAQRPVLNLGGPA